MSPVIQAEPLRMGFRLGEALYSLGVWGRQSWSELSRSTPLAKAGVKV